MSTAWLAAFASLALVVGCSGSAAPGITSTGQSGEISATPGGEPTEVPVSKHSSKAPDAGSKDDPVDASTPDAIADAAVDAEPPPPSACEECSATSCAAQQKACADDATCPLLKVCLDECTTSECRSDCFVQYPDPEAKAKNGALYKCECITACSTSCKVECS